MYEVVVWPTKKGEATWEELSFSGLEALMSGKKYFDTEAKKGNISGFKSNQVYDTFFISGKMLEAFCDHMEQVVGVSPLIFGSKVPKPDINRRGDYKVYLSDI